MRVAIANRGEVAVRIIRACQELGYETILLAAQPDHNSLAARVADLVYDLTGSAVAETYLNRDQLIAAAKAAKADHLHPGFGFLSESAEFAQAVQTAKIKFIGPQAATIERLGNKAAAKALAATLGIPTIPGFFDPKANRQKLLAAAKKLGLPIIIKAAAGGGGRGMKLVEKEDDFTEQLSSAKREALAAFGSDEIILEKLLVNPKHVEVQLLGDTHGNLIHLGERDCSLQRRYQKVIEEAPALHLNPKLRERLLTDAIKLGKAVDYVNAGTVEFLVDGDQHYFMEVNTRLQVEHPVTEMVYGVDLVKLQLLVADGKTLPWKQSELIPHGHALESRIYAENTAHDFVPVSGTLAQLMLPLGPNRRFDFGYSSGDTIPSEYDSMIGKVITWDRKRDDNIARHLATLNEMVIFGVPTNIEFIKAVLSHNDFRAQRIHNHWLSEKFPRGFAYPELDADTQKLAISTGQQPTKPKITSSLHYESPWTSR